MKISTNTAVNRLMRGAPVYYKGAHPIASITVCGGEFAGFHTVKLKSGRSFGMMANNENYFYNSNRK